MGVILWIELILATFCKDLYKAIQRSGTEGRVAWSFLKPLIRGRVLFAPNTPETRAIMNKVR